jgi:hypothetical protein
MAVKSRNSIWHTIHLLARLAGVTAITAALCGCFIWGVLDKFEFGPYEYGEQSIGPYTGEQIGLVVICVCGAVVGLALLFEVRGIVQGVASHRGLFGFNVLVQIVLAIALVVGGNIYSFEHYRRFDLTQSHIFTLDDPIQEQLKQLRGDTDIIVVQKHVSFGQRSRNEQDEYDFAAQAKIVEKVKDLAEAFGDLGPRFHVQILDVKDRNNKKKIEAIGAELSEDLAKAIRKAPENSVFLFSREKKRFQRISFSDIYQLDKQGSIESDNLVLKFQGNGPFARKILNIEEKTPRVAMAVVHFWLSFRDKSEPRFTMSGAKKLFDTYGIDSSDIILRKLSEEGLGDPTVLTFDESQYEDIEDILADLTEEIEGAKKVLDNRTELYKLCTESSLAALNKKFAYFILPGRQGIIPRDQIEKFKKSFGPAKIIDVDEDDRKAMIAETKKDIELISHALDQNREEQAQLTKKKSELRVDNLAEKRRFTDIEAKAKAMLADVDLLIVPRITLMDAPSGEVVGNRVHRLDKAQFNAVKAFMKQGKPVLFLLGPPVQPGGPRPDFGEGTGDEVESMLGELGFHLPKQAILYDMEKREFNERKFGGFGKPKRDVDVPGLRVDETTPIYPRAKTQEDFKPHPIRTSMRVMTRTMGIGDPDSTPHKDKDTAVKETKSAEQADSDAAIRVRHPRPVYFMRTTLPPDAATGIPDAATGIVGALGLPGMPGAWQAASIWTAKAQYKPDNSAVFLLTREECWNEANPFIVQNKVPRFTPAKDDDPNKGTVDEERQGPFPIGVAVETQIPASWLDKDVSKAAKVRVAVIGSGGAFVGPTLPPLKEKMLLDTANWLLGRDDLLARDADSWQYPRVSLSPLEHKCWYVICYGLPCLFIYLGTAVWLLRRMR